MRAGVYTVHQSLTAEAAAVLKLSLGLARRRGHAQVTPLHVAATLLTSSAAAASSSSHLNAFTLLKRACLRSSSSSSSPHGQCYSAMVLATHSLQCRALELCFNVALNRLPACSGAGNGSFVHEGPTLSNALVAALKRAQANQRRGCIELQQLPPAHQQQQPVVTVRVELEQLILSILDDPSVSRVMREAGFSSAAVKANLEEEAAQFSSSAPAPAPAPAPALAPAFFLPQEASSARAGSHLTEEVRAVMEVMARKAQGRKSNPVVMGDSAAAAEAIAQEVFRRVERGDAPGELRGLHCVHVQLSFVHLKLMAAADVETKIAELRRATRLPGSRGLLLYIGDLRWAAAGEDDESSAAEAMVSEVTRMVSESKNNGEIKLWVMATASYQTFIKCQRRKPSLEASWGLQAVVVPSAGGLSLSLHRGGASPSPSGALDGSWMASNSLNLLEPPPRAMADDDDKLFLCAECGHNYEKEAAATAAKMKNKNNAAGVLQLPDWFHPDRPSILQNNNDGLVELKRKWSRLCRRLHQCPTYPYSSSLLSVFGKSSPAAAAQPWPPLDPPKQEMGPLSLSLARMLKAEPAFAMPDSSANKQQSPAVSLSSLKESVSGEAKDTVAPGGGGAVLLSDSATSDDKPDGRGFKHLAHELRRRLQENIPWQPAAADAIADAFLNCRKEKGAWLLLQGSDLAAKRRAAMVIAEAHSGSADRLICVDAKASAGGGEALAKISETEGSKIVVLVSNVDQAVPDLLDYLGSSPRNERILILATSESSSAAGKGVESGGVINLRMWLDGTSPSPPRSGGKRKSCAIPQQDGEPKKKPRKEEFQFDLNLCADEADQDEEAVPSDVTHEGRSLDSLAAATITMDSYSETRRREASSVDESLTRALKKVSNVETSDLRVDEEAAAAVAAAAGWFTEAVLERWAEKVLRRSAASLAERRRGGGVIRVGLAAEGSPLVEGFMRTPLPSEIET